MDFEDFTLDYYIDQIRNKNKELVKEDAFILGSTMMVGSLIIISSLVSFFLGASSLKNSIKVDSKLSNRINKILTSESNWIVHRYPDVIPNAFAIGGNHVFISTELIKILTPREQDAVLLHEIFHNKDLHIWKKIAFESVFTYLIVFVSITAGITVNFLPFALILIFLLKNSAGISYARIMGRYHEIKADEFAVINGYGKELITALNKIEKFVETLKSNKTCNKFCQLERKISKEIDEHPSTKKRVEIILRKTNELQRAMGSGFSSIQKFVTGVFKNNG